MKDITKEFLLVEYVKNKRSFKDIAEELKTYTNKVRRKAVQFGIKPRTKSEAQKEALSSGRIKHPTEGTSRPESVKNKIGDSMHRSWEQIDDKERERRSEVSRKQWNDMSDEKQRRLLSSAFEGIRRASIEGSKLEKFLLNKLVEAGYKTEFHKEYLLVNSRLHIDIFLPELSTAIEVDGPSHFEPIWGDDQLKKVQRSDGQKTGLILSNGMVLIRIKQGGESSKYFHRKVWSKLNEELKKIDNKFPVSGNRLIEI